MSYLIIQMVGDSFTGSEPLRWLADRVFPDLPVHSHYWPFILSERAPPSLHVDRPATDIHPTYSWAASCSLSLNVSVRWIWHNIITENAGWIERSAIGTEDFNWSQTESTYGGYVGRIRVLELRYLNVVGAVMF